MRAASHCVPVQEIKVLDFISEEEKGESPGGSFFMDIFVGSLVKRANCRFPSEYFSLPICAG